MHRQRLLDAHERIGHHDRHGIGPLFRAVEHEGRIAALLHLLAVDRPRIEGIERTLDVERREADRTARGEVVLRAVERPRERHLVGRADPHAELHGILAVLVAGFEAERVFAGLLLHEDIVLLGGDLRAVHAPRIGRRKRRLGHERFQFERLSCQHHEPFVRTGEADGRNLQLYHVDAQLLRSGARGGRNAQPDEHPARRLAAERIGGTAPHDPAVDRPCVLRVVRIFVGGADRQIAARLHLVDSRFAVERNHRLPSRRHTDLLILVARGEYGARRENAKQQSLHFRIVIHSFQNPEPSKKQAASRGGKRQHRKFKTDRSKREKLFRFSENSGDTNVVSISARHPAGCKSYGTHRQVF